jgi:predicted esterase
MPNARLLIPTPAGGTYRLAVDEGVFAYTPRAAGNLFFAAVETGSFVVNAGNSAAGAFLYDPVNDPVRPHPQFSGTTPGGFPYTAYVVWAEGRDDHTNARPDIPVLGDADKNGVPHVFTITSPIGGAPNRPLSCAFAMHGGGGEYQLFRPGIPARANLSLPLTDGLVISPDDSYYASIGTNLARVNTSWFGYSPDADPFDQTLPRSSPPAHAVVVNFTQRRVHWILDWLLRPNSPQPIDPQRVVMIGHSGGGRGTSHLTRLRPERFAAAVIYTPPSDLPLEGSGQENFLRGDWANPLNTNLLDRDGIPFNSTQVFTMTTRLSATQRDIPLTRIYYGKRDEEGPATWSTSQRAVFDSLHDADLGYMLFWDEREHGVEKWDQETDDSMDGHAGPWPDVGQWVAPVRTRRASVQYLVDTYRASLSYPAFRNSDEDPITPGTQPDPGPGDPNLGDTWGTWGGHFDWSSPSIIDQPTLWEARIFVSGLAPASVDNALVSEITADLSPRRTQRFNPAEGTPIYWYALRSDESVVSQQGIVSAGPEGIVTVPGLVVPRQDIATLRVVLATSPSCVGNTSISAPADALAVPGGSAQFTVTPEGSGPFLVRWQREAPRSSGIWTDIPNGVVQDLGVVTGALTPTLSIASLDQNAQGFFRAVITNACGTINSSPAELIFCPADFNRDGFLDFFDYDDFVAAFESGAPRSDFNRDGFLDFFDYDAFVLAFETGC